MGPPPAAPDYTNVNNAKDLFDEVGKYIEKKVHDEALTRDSSKLHGLLSKVKFSNNEKTYVIKACDIDKGFETNVTSGHSNPCEGRSKDRFSDTQGAECHWRSIKGSISGNTVGACAPHRRLSLCDQNLEQIEPHQIKNTHNLYIDVLLAAKYEGQMIATKLKEYDATNYESRICTELARSFADIGDIVRGRDLYLGKKKRGQTEREKLEEKLQSFFEQIYNSLEEKERNHYNDDTTDFFKLREDWWDANRLDVWKAITCYAPDEAKYKVIKPDGSTKDSTWKKCRGVTDVLTNFDYVPQYLRWFEEWAEDFCRIKRRKLQNLEKECRGMGENDKKRYCSRNGYDCEKTVRARGELCMGNRCINCFYACPRYEKWLTNQKQEFLKQKQKYINEISGKSGERHNASNNYEGYEKKFYDEFKTKYNDVDKFLKLLNKEKECTNIDDKEGKIDFKEDHDKDNNTVKEKGTFYRSDYCEPCPLCGVKCEGGTCTERTREEGNCPSIYQIYEPKHDDPSTEITILSSGEGHDNINKKLDDFCKNSNDNSLYEEWKCYYRNAKNEACILKKENKNKNKSKDQPDKIQKSYNHFFMFWVAHMLKDSIHWRTRRLRKCINNGKKECIKNCNDKCKCFLKWVAQKKEEWGKIKTHFGKQDDIGIKGLLGELSHYGVLEWNLKEEFLKEDSQSRDEDAEEMKHLKKILNLENENTLAVVNAGTEENTTIDKLLQHEKDEAELCLEIHPEDEECSDEDDDDDHHEEEVYVNNPCAKPSGSYPSLANKAAQLMHDQAKTQLASRAGRSKLKANASLGTYRRQGTPSDFEKSKLCKITAKHSNDSRPSGGPCTGKDGNKRGDRMKIGTPWSKVGEKNKTSYEDVYLPPRRQHMCTSNLENLDLSKEGLSNSSIASNSLLGDVLLAAKYQAEDTIKDYQPTSDQEGICRAMKYSFADLGDIIRGRDLWETNEGEKTTQGKVKEIFHIIYKNDPDIEKKYKKIEDQKHLHLREDWWEANRHQVWRAMKCEIKKDSKIPCSGIPIEDYIPQRLRWMTEFAEWYCKAQNKYYEELVGACVKCQDKTTECTQGTDDCQKCISACAEYKTKIERWQKQWDAISDKYQILYLQAKIDAHGVLQDQPVVDFLKELHQANSGTSRSKRATATPTTIIPPTPYSSAAGYIHQEAHISDCQKQNQFCKKKNGETPSSDEKDNDKEYAFRSKAYDHDNACDCEKNKPKPVPQVRPWGSGWKGRWGSFKLPEMFHQRKKKKNACEIVREILRTNNGKSKVGECYPKNNDKNYPEWTCDEKKIKTTEVGACMPPRRQKLCLYYLKQEINNTEGLKNAFVKCAAAETFLSWNYFKAKNGNNAQTQLKAGKIPPEFLRSMFYTYGDYRDICLGKDIGNDVDSVKNNINKVFTKSVRPRGETSDTKRQKWWNDYGSHIWKGMLCALSYDTEEKNVNTQIRQRLTKNYEYKYVTFGIASGTTLEKFASRPQFLRWFTEWGEDFCKKRKKQLDQLVNVCKECNVSDSVISSGNKTCNDTQKCNACKTQCKKYQEWIGTWREHYNKQKKKFQRDKENGMYKMGPGGTEENSANNARDYLKTQLQNMKCVNGTTDENCDYTCMNESSSTARGDSMPESLDEKPKEVKEKCNCIRDECSGLSVTGSGIPDGSAFGGGVPDKKCAVFKGGLPKRIEPPQYDPTNDILKSTIPVTIVLALGSIAFLFIKKKTKSSVGNLFQILQIPKGDYRIPTPKSANRYIPYVSDTYKGKTYIYMEGDSSGDEKYAFMSDTTDITSSESEYEESIHDRNLYSGEEYNYNVNMSTNSMDDIPINSHNNVYSGIDLINDTLGGNKHIDIYDELLKRKENELFGTEHHPKRTTTNHFATPTRDDPLHNQLELFHTWLDRHRDMCEKWENHHERLAKLKEEWNKDNNNSGNINPSDSNKTLNTNVSIQIDMDNPKTTNEFTYVDSNPNQVDDTYVDSNPNQVDDTYVDSNPDNSSMDTILEDLEKYNEPYYDVQDDIYYDVNDHDTSTVDSNTMDVPSKVQIEMDVNTKLVKEKYPIADV
ncbi:hypothetical protein PFMC_03995 [Plasmodium falciparum CAMP/Malaysia]|uniref:Erythrocyte membrane protein 1 n=1 Tax=Plasmodium falciparum (isolate Camp / Malaysia) TaxID=5835 RepID=A0A024X3N4_PLAFC|nr:hypothetical protein PFMC_03995 [Plasmodium falciparum CAMP/Malaysia]